ncbi:MAG: response regulator [bacterium]
MSKILIIDDEEGVRITLKKIMEKEGYAVDTAPDFKEAIVLLDKNSYDTVVTDILLPGMNGIELLSAIKARNEDLPVIVITGAPDIDTATEALRKAAYDYIPKPITKHNLPPVVARAVEKKALMDVKKRLENENLEYQRDLEKKVKDRTAKLIRAERLATLGTFVSFVSHELRTPLSVIRNSNYYIRTKIKPPTPKIEKYFKMIDDQVDMAHKIIDNFLNFSKGRPLELCAVDMNQLIEKIVDLIKVPDKIHVVFNLQSDLPKIEIDKDYIQQVLINILNNAIQSMTDGGELRIATREVDRSVSIDISDTGVGIEKKNLGRLFEPFFTKKTGGTGLGLVICKFLVEQHGGSITVTSEVGKGSSFSINLPLASERK